MERRHGHRESHLQAGAGAQIPAIYGLTRRADAGRHQACLFRLDPEQSRVEAAE